MPRTAPRWTVQDIGDQAGRAFLVTGANSGLGFETARELAAHGARVVLTARSEAKGTGAVNRIRAAVPGAAVEARVLDLADLDSVRAFAAALTRDAVGVDVLVDNAGVMMPPRRLSPQGHESQFATNHLGHFALAGLLFATLARGRDPRVVTVTSTMHRVGRIRFEDLTGENGYSPTGYYAQSKFANVLFALELDRRARASHSPVRSLLAHPGYASTNLQTSGPIGVSKQIMRVGNVLLAQSAKAGALPELRAAVDPEAESGAFFGPAYLSESRGHPRLVQPVASARDEETARRLWEYSEEATGVVYPF